MNILLVSHGDLCVGIKNAYRMLVASDDNVSTISLVPERGVGAFRNNLRMWLGSLHEGEDVLILADLWGGTPFNESYACFLEDPVHLRLVSGLNLPMLLTVGLESLTSDNLEALYQLAISAGAKGVRGADLPDESEEADEDCLLF